MIRERFHRAQRETPVLCHCARDENLPAGICYGPVIRDIFILECCTEGKGTVVINGVEFPFRAGDCFFLLPADPVIHTADPVTSRRGVWCALDGLSVGKTLARAGITSAQPFAPPEVFSVALAQMEEMLSDDGTDPGLELRQSARISMILGNLLRTASPSKVDAAVRRAEGIMETRYYEPLTVTEIACAVGMDRAYFSTVFKEQTGFSPHRYLCRLRIRKACAFLENGGYGVGQIATLTGMDPQNFARLFKRETGMTPLEYRSSRDTTKKRRFYHVLPD